MARRSSVRRDLVPGPLLPHETLYVGIDVGKFRHVAGFLSRSLLVRHERFEGCPTLAFEQSREQFPTPDAITTASLADLKNAYKSEHSESQRGYHLSEAKMLSLQELARETIGTHDSDRQHSLTIEQKQLIRELRIIVEHLEELQDEITSSVTASREGQILLSIPPIGPIQAATIIASVGNIANFERACELKSYFGWAPRRDQTGMRV